MVNMKNLFVALSCAVAVILLSSLLFGQSETDSFNGRTTTKISVSPGNESGVMVCQATVTDVSTGEILAQPTLRFRKGEPAKLATAMQLGPDSADNVEFTIEVDVSEDGKTLSYSSAVVLNGNLVSGQEVSFNL